MSIVNPSRQVRVEYLHEPELYISDVLARVKPEYLQQRYNLPEYDPNCHPLCKDEELEENKKNGVAKQADEEEVEKGEERVYLSTAQWPVDFDLFLELVSKKTGKLLKVCAAI